MMQPLQKGFPGMCIIEEAVATMAVAGAEARGAVFTRSEVVEFILDLVGYDQKKDLSQLRLLEPSFGAGDFLIPVMHRLIQSTIESKQSFESLSPCIRAVELHTATFEATKLKMFHSLIDLGVDRNDALHLVECWLISGDFLLAELDGPFDFVVGNPPYVRQEMIPDVLLNAYRAKFTTLYDRADLYVPFIEHSLQLLCEGGVLGFICSDRWVKNRYGGPLREMISKDYNLRVFVDMVDTPAFHTEVTAYPAIVSIAREPAGETKIVERPTIESLSTLAADLRSGSSGASSIANVVSGSQPWVLNANKQLPLLRRLEVEFPTIEEAGCKVGIGVATGADSAFIGDYETLDVEPDRKLPLAMTKDIVSGSVIWMGAGIVNPFCTEGGLVPLAEFPRLKQYLESRRDAIEGRHVAKKNRESWYRTIDRIYPDIATRPKLLIPDIKGEANVVFEEGRLYPHHNLYYVISDTWDLRALQAVLLSDIAHMFIASYSTLMRGGYLRFQAQYLRRIRIPYWHSVPEEIREDLVSAAVAMDQPKCNDVVARLYNLTLMEKESVSR